MGRWRRAWKPLGKLSPHRNVTAGRNLYAQNAVLLVDPDVVFESTHVERETLCGHSSSSHLHSLHVPLDKASSCLTAGAGHDDGDGGWLLSGPLAEKVIVMGEEVLENDGLGPSTVFALPLPSAGCGHRFEALSIIAETGDLVGGHSHLIAGELQIPPTSLEERCHAFDLSSCEQESSLGDNDGGLPLATPADLEGLRGDLTALYVNYEGAFVERDILPLDRPRSEQRQGGRYGDGQQAFQDPVLRSASTLRFIVSGPVRARNGSCLA